jgi:hypothetical protein
MLTANPFNILFKKNTEQPAFASQEISRPSSFLGSHPTSPELPFPAMLNQDCFHKQNALITPVRFGTSLAPVVFSGSGSKLSTQEKGSKKKEQNGLIHKNLRKQDNWQNNQE